MAIDLNDVLKSAGFEHVLGNLYFGSPGHIDAVIEDDSIKVLVPVSQSGALGEDARSFVEGIGKKHSLPVTYAQLDGLGVAYFVVKGEKKDELVAKIEDLKQFVPHMRQIWENYSSQWSDRSLTSIEQMVVYV